MNRIKHKTLGFITVTAAKVSDDLRHATIYISVLDEKESKRTLRKINSSAPFIRSELGKRLKMKHIPSLRIVNDEAIEYGRKIDDIFDQIKSERSSVDNDEDLF
jgi:ribosome-binding factor A